MKKQDISPIVATILIILITISAVTIIYIVIMPMISDELQPEFRITIEECRNETIREFEIQFPKDFRITDCPAFAMKNVSCYDSHDNIIIGLECREKKVCYEIIGFEYIGVFLYDDWIIDFYKSDKYTDDFLNQTVEVCEDVEVEELNLTIKQIFPYEVELTLTKKKEDLTIDWLNSFLNYGCFLYGEDVCEVDRYEVTDPEKQCEFIDFYQCGDYKVEVLR